MSFGKLAQEYCNVSLPLQVLKSRAGYYLGTFDPESGPCSRESLEYFHTEQDASEALLSGNFTQLSEP